MNEPNAKAECTVPEGAETQRPRKRFSPDVDIYETSDAVVVVADIPGVPREGIEVSLEKNVLTIRGTVRDAPPEGFRLGYAEYETGDYQRSFSLSDEIDGERIDATLGHGVLTLTLPKIRPNQKTITVHAN